MASLKAHPASEVKTPYSEMILNPPKDCEAESCGDSIIAIKPSAIANNISIHTTGRTLFITGVIAGKSAKVDVFDMQGRPIFSTKCEKGRADLSAIAEGLYVVRVHDGSTSIVKRIAIK